MLCSALRAAAGANAIDIVWIGGSGPWNANGNSNRTDLVGDVLASRGLASKTDIKTPTNRFDRVQVTGVNTP